MYVRRSGRCRSIALTNISGRTRRSPEVECGIRQRTHQIGYGRKDKHASNFSRPLGGSVYTQGEWIDRVPHQSPRATRTHKGERKHCSASIGVVWKKRGISEQSRATRVDLSRTHNYRLPGGQVIYANSQTKTRSKHTSKKQKAAKTVTVDWKMHAAAYSD